MQILTYVFFGYLAGTILLAARVGWHMVFRFDRFDWFYSKGEKRASFVVTILLWPLLLVKPSIMLGIILDPSKLFEQDLGFAARMREEARLWNKPPPCAAVIQYQQGGSLYEETFGEFVFRAGDVQDALVSRIRENQGRPREHEAAILKWVRQRNDAIREPTPVPDAWWGFQEVADDLVRQGLAEVRCFKCGAMVPNHKLLRKDDHGCPGSNYNRLTCPEGHWLLVVETIHIMVRSRADSCLYNET